MQLRLLAAVACLALPSAAQAGPAADAVARFYANPGTEMKPEMRRYFTDPARGVLDRDEATGAGCVPAGFAVDVPGHDAAELKRTLELRESVQGDGAIVMAYFRQSGERRAIEWTLSRQGRSWLVADVMSLQGGWRLSDLPCG